LHGHHEQHPAVGASPTLIDCDTQDVGEEDVGDTLRVMMELGQEPLSPHHPLPLPTRLGVIWGCDLKPTPVGGPIQLD
jgi:hypothetical protein